MEKLKKEFTKYKFIYKMLKRNEHAVIYEQFGENATTRKFELYGYEVHIIRISEAKEVNYQVQTNGEALLGAILQMLWT